MKKSFHIFQRDLSRLLHNKAAILVLIGVCLLPSLYAWFNIAANLDPYGNTSKIKVAIACLDKEASSENLSINAGKEIVKNLKENKQLGWTFTSEKEALNGVKSGKYYASIVIPEDFSRSLISILSGDLQTPKLDYYINEKANAIAPKITGTGAAAIQEQINSTFSSVASESVSGILKQSASDLSSTLGSVNSDITKTLEKADANIAAYKQLLENFNAAAEKSAPLITRAKSTASSLKSAASSGSSALSESSRILSETRTAAGNFSSSLSSSLTQGEILLGQAHNIASAGLTDLETAARSVNGSIGNALDFANSTAVLNGNILKIRGAVVMDVDNNYVHKQENKSVSGTRDIILVDYASKRLNAIKNGRTTGSMSEMTPSGVLKGLKRLCRELGINEYSMHSLRHYHASTMLSLNIPDKYAMEILGQNSPHMLKTVYQHTFSSEFVKVNSIINEHYNNIMQHEMQHNKK